MSDRDTIRRALHDAIDWQKSLLDAYSGIPDDPVVPEIRGVLTDYRRVLKRRYGRAETPQERKVDGARLIGLNEIRENARFELPEKVDPTP